MTALAITTERLTLRTFRASDAPQLQDLISNWDIARMTGRIPYPYPDGAAATWIASHSEERAKGNFHFAVVWPEAGPDAIGCVGLHPTGCATDGEPGVLEIGYWIGQPYWGRGLMSEAAAAVTEFAFTWLRQDRIVAGANIDNPASARVLAKIGYRETGRMFRPSLARGCDVDCWMFALTRDAWAAKKV